MPIEYITLTDASLPAMQELLLPWWGKNWSPDLADRIFRWRFIDRPDGETILAMDGSRCIAMVDSWTRPYFIDGEPVRVRELADWYSLPEYRGAGLQPMWMMMRKPEPIVGMGGTDATRNLLPRLKFQSMPQEAGLFTLKLSSGAFAERLLRRIRPQGVEALAAVFHRLSLPVRRVRPIPLGAKASVRALQPGDSLDATRPSPKDYAIARLTDAGELDWLRAAPPEMGEFSALAFLDAGRLLGLSITRVYSMGHHKEAFVLHVQSADARLEVYSWMVSESATFVASRGATVIQGRASCPILCDALVKVGFSQYASLAPRWWSQHRDAPTGALLLTWLRGDDGLLPYPSG